MRRERLFPVLYLVYCGTCAGAYLYFILALRRLVIIGALLAALVLIFLERAHSGLLNGR